MAEKERRRAERYSVFLNIPYDSAFAVSVHPFLEHSLPFFEQVRCSDS